MLNNPLTAFSMGAVLSVVLASQALAAAGTLATAPVVSSSDPGLESFDGVVEAVRQTVVAAQVSGSVIEIRVRAGDVVKAGQVLARLDARAADQSVVASDAQVQAARASLDVATQEFERQKRMLEKNYISQAAFERAQAQYKSTEAQVTAQLAQAGAARTQSSFFSVTAPYTGVVSEVPIAVGDMALPGKRLFTLYDPAAMRVTAMIPQSAIAGHLNEQGIRIELPGPGPDRQSLKAARLQVLPTVDPGTHTVEVRAELGRETARIVPGMFARVWISRQAISSTPSAAGPGAAMPARLFVPSQSVFRRSEVTALYVVDAGGRPILHQIRVGEARGDSIEILSGVSAGESVALDPQAAARVR